MDRRGFFRRLSGQKRAMRPPGAISEDIIGEHCNGCGDCIEACPQTVIRLVANHLPIVCFDQNGCTFCGRCAEACKQDAIVANADLQSSWLPRARISSNCLDKLGTICRACESTCENNAIGFSPALGGKTDVFVRIENCNGCGTCIASCPTTAIEMYVPQVDTFEIKENAA
ncbi:MAG: ferredoxin-type protein NapF [Hyphomicrobiales bacterium]|nr:ferredoxin-type protein NapF [Hyphomicrobiales bacterium]